MFTSHLTPPSRKAPLFAKGLIRTTLALALTLPPGIALQANTPNDAAIAKGVCQALASHPALGAARITVVVHDGIVGLSGYVDSPYEQVVADTVARRVDGVRAVDNNLIERRELPLRLTVEPAGDL
jgi:hypothetical protein